MLLSAHELAQAGHPIVAANALAEDLLFGRGPLEAGKLATLLTAEDLCTACLCVAHLYVHKCMPLKTDYSLRFSRSLFLVDWTPFRSQDAHVMSAVESLRPCFETGIALFRGEGDDRANKLTLIINFVLMELELGDLERARMLCQHFLRSSPSLPELWSLYAHIEQMVLLPFILSNQAPLSCA